jgi:hypothetical protein
MSTETYKYLKGFDIIAAFLLIAGGINWGLVGLFGFNLVEVIFGSMTAVSRFIYLLIGLAGLYDAIMWRSIQRRWECKLWPGVAESAAA